MSGKGQIYIFLLIHLQVPVGRIVGKQYFNAVRINTRHGLVQLSILWKGRFPPVLHANDFQADHH